MKKNKRLKITERIEKERIQRTIGTKKDNNKKKEKLRE